MPTLTGTVADVTGVAVPNNLIREVFVKAPASRPAGGNPAQLVTTRIVPVTVGAGGTLSVTLDPGPAVLVIHTVGAAPDTFNLVVLGNMTTLREAIIEDIGELPELEHSELVALAAQVRKDADEAHRVVSDASSTLADMKATDTATGQARTDAQAAAAAAADSQSNAKTSETNAKTSETNAKTSEMNSKTSETNAAASKAAADASKTAAKTSETNAKTSETNAASSATASANSAAQADTSRAAAEAAKMAAEAAKMNWRGAWSGSTAYTARDVVFYGGSSYWATASIASGQAAPPAGNWQMLASKGDPGANGSSAWVDIQNKPSVFPSDIANVSGLDAALTGKAPVPTGTASAGTFYSSSGTWATPTNTTYAAMTQAVADAGSSTTANTVSAKVVRDTIGKAAVQNATYGTAATLWFGTQAQYDALAATTKNAAGFVAVITA